MRHLVDAHSKRERVMSASADLSRLGRLGESSRLGHAAGESDVMGCKWHICADKRPVPAGGQNHSKGNARPGAAGADTPPGKRYFDAGSGQWLRGKAHAPPAVAVISALLGAAVGLTVPAVGPGNGPSAGSLAGEPGTARLTAMTLATAQSRAGSGTPAVAPLRGLTEADLMVVAPASLTARTRARSASTPKVAAGLAGCANARVLGHRLPGEATDELMSCAPAERSSAAMTTYH